MTKHSGNVDVPADEWTSLLPVCRNLYATSYFIQQKRLGYKYHMNTLFLMRAKICLLRFVFTEALQTLQKRSEKTRQHTSPSTTQGSDPDCISLL